MSLRQGFLLFMIASAIVFPIIGYNMGKKRILGPIKGALFGFFLGFPGILMILLYPTHEEAQARYFSAADELEKFKKLLDIGAINQHEYDTKKAELLRQ